MIQFFQDWGSAVISMILEAGPFLLLGLFVAGLLKALLPAAAITKHLGGNDLRSVALATLIGAPLPLCSCSVIPTAVELRKKGASKGATTAFLISTPETGVDSIGVTWALIDPLMTLARPLAAIVTAFGAGAIVNFLERRGWLKDVSTDSVAPASDCCDDTASCAAPVLDEHGHGDAHGHDHGHDHEHARAETAAPARRSVLGVLREAVGYGLGPLLEDLTPWFVLGFLLSGLITVLVPENFFGDVIPPGLWAMLLMLALSVPMYICASASTPVAAALMAKGLDPGAALVFMLAGPATNIATILVVGRFLGWRSLAAYLASIVAGSLLFGTLLDFAYKVFSIDVTIRSQATESSQFSYFTIACGVVLVLGVLRHAWRTSLLFTFESWLARIGLVPSRSFARSLFVGAVVVVWGSTSYSVVLPGQTGFVLRWGRVVDRLEGPATVWHLPYPISRFEAVSTSSIERGKVGLEEGSAAPPPLSATGEFEPQTDDVECVTSDEKLLIVTYAIHYRIVDPYVARFQVQDLKRVVETCAASSLRRMVAHHSMDEHLVDRREPLELEAKGYLSEQLEKIGCGVEVLAVTFEYMHAPPQVHYAYRDVASSLEDKETSIKNGVTYKLEQMAQARADAEQIEQKALGDGALARAEATRVVAGFEALAPLHQQYGSTFASMLVIESWKKSIKNLNGVVPLAPNVAVTIVQKGSGASAAVQSDGDGKGSATPSGKDD